MNLPEDIRAMPIAEVVDRIIHLNWGITAFWKSPRGWAPMEAADLLSRSRLDWQFALSKTLHLWVHDYDSQDEGRLILAWVNLGALVEGSLKWFLSVFYDNYHEDVEAIRDKEKKLVEPDSRWASFDRLRQFFEKRIWEDHEKGFGNCVQTIQQRRNAIHAYKNREIGTFLEFQEYVRFYLALLRSLNSRAPYPAMPPSEEEFAVGSEGDE